MSGEREGPVLMGMGEATRKVCIAQQRRDETGWGGSQQRGRDCRFVHASPWSHVPTCVQGARERLDNLQGDFSLCISHRV